MKLLALLLLPFPVLACDWKATVTTDPMTDDRKCQVHSDGAGLSFFVVGNDPPYIIAASAYRRPGVTIRIDDNEAIRVTGNPQAVRVVVSQIQTGTRMRTLIQDYPSFHEGDVAICNLPRLLASCTP